MFFKKLKPQYLDIPIYAIVCLKDKVLISGGGGGKEFGVNMKNKIIVFKRGYPSNQLKDVIFELPTDDNLIDKMNVHKKLQIVTASAEEKCIVYLVKDNGNIIELARFQSDFHLKEPCQNDSKLNRQGNLLATGGDDGIIRIWDFQFKDNKAEVKKSFELISHSDCINSVDFHVQQNLLISASKDKTCRIFNLSTKSMIKKLSFGEGIHSIGFKFFSAHFSLDEKHIYTIQNQDRGSSFFTKWEEDSIEAIKTIKLHKNPICASNLSQEGLFMGVASGDGLVKIINLRYMDVENEKQAHDMVVKGLDFTSDTRYLITGTPEMTIDILPNNRKQGIFSGLYKLAILIMILLWVFQFLKQTFKF